MTIWDILQIEQTKDAAAIKAAYLALLPDNAPEDNPEGFKALRCAYEAAQSAASGGGDEGLVDTPASRVALRIEALCQDFYARCDVNNWREIFESDDCADLITQNEIFESLLKLLMTDIFVPQTVWKAIDDFFGIKERFAELKQRFGDGFLRYAVSCVDNAEVFRPSYIKREDAAALPGIYELFTKMCKALREGEIEKAGELARGIDDIGITHPDILCLELEVARAEGSAYRGTGRIICALTTHFGDDARCLFFVGKHYYESHEAAAALPYFEAALKIAPDDFGTRLLLSAVLDEACGRDNAADLERGKALVLGCLNESPYNALANVVMTSICEKLAALYVEDCTDFETRYKLAACLYNTRRFDECARLLGTVKHDIGEVGSANAAKYNELMFDICAVLNQPMTQEDKIQARGYLRAWEESETVRSRLTRLPSCYIAIGDDETALLKSEALSKEFARNPELAISSLNILKRGERAAEAVRYAEYALVYHPEDIALIAALAEYYYEINDYIAAIEKINYGLNVSPRFAALRLLQTRLLYDMKEAGALREAAQEAIAHCGARPEFLMYLAVASFHSAGYKDQEEARETAKRVADALSSIEEDCEDRTPLYETLAEAASASGDYETCARAYTRLIEICENRGTPNPTYFVRRGIIFGALGQPQKERDDYLFALKINPDFGIAHFRLGIMHEFVAEDAKAALDAYARACACDYANPEFSNRYIRVLGVLGAIEAATVCADKWIEAFAANTAGVLLINRARLFAYVKSRKYEEGAALAKSVFEDESEKSADAETSRLLGVCFFNLGQRDTALVWLSSALQANSADCDTFLALFDLYMADKDYSKAVLAARDAVKYSEGSPAAYIALAEALTAAKEEGDEARFTYILARDMLKYLIRRRPYACAYYHLAKAHAALGDKKPAARCAKKAIEAAQNDDTCIDRRCLPAEDLLESLKPLRSIIRTTR